MKKIGLIGGISWVSTLQYYELINKGVNKQLGGLNSAECIIYSINFHDLYTATWTNAYDLLLNACNNLKQAGVDALALCANTAHLYVDELARATGIPFIDIGKATAQSIKNEKLIKVGLLGTKFTMEMDFIKNKIRAAGITVLTPADKADLDFIQYTLQNELGVGIINPDTKERYCRIIDKLIDDGAQGIILGCTEIPLIIGQEDVPVHVFDTTQIHANAIVNYALQL